MIGLDGYVFIECMACADKRPRNNVHPNYLSVIYYLVLNQPNRFDCVIINTIQDHNMVLNISAIYLLVGVHHLLSFFWKGRAVLYSSFI